MAATFDPTLSNDRDWVRLQIGDTTSPFKLQDETIDALLSDEGGNKYEAAARALEGIYSQVIASGEGVVKLKLGDLELELSGNDIVNRIKQLRSGSATGFAFEMYYPCPLV